MSLILLSLSLFTWGIGEGMFYIFQPIYLKELGADTMTTAGILSAFGFAMMLAHIPAGYLADRIGRKPLLVAAWSTGMLATWVMALANSLPIFVVGMLLYGLTAFVSAPMFSYVTAASGKLSPARAMTLTSAAFNLGAVLGPGIGGYLGENFSLRFVYQVAAMIFVFSTFILLFIRSQPREIHDPSAPPPSLWTNQRYLGFLVVLFVSMLVMYLPQPLTPRFLQSERGLSLSAVGSIGVAGNFGNVVMNVVLGSLPARFGSLLAQGCVALFALLMWIGTGQPWYAVGYFLMGGYRAARPLYFAQIRAITHPSQMGIAYGLSETVSSSTIVLAPLLAGVLYDRDPVLVFPVSVGLILLSLAGAALFLPRQTVAEPPPLLYIPPESPFSD